MRSLLMVAAVAAGLLLCGAPVRAGVVYVLYRGPSLPLPGGVAIPPPPGTTYAEVEFSDSVASATAPWSLPAGLASGFIRATVYNLPSNTQQPAILDITHLASSFNPQPLPPIGSSNGHILDSGGIFFGFRDIATEFGPIYFRFGPISDLTRGIEYNIGRFSQSFRGIWLEDSQPGLRPIPEPTSLAMMGLGLVSVAVMTWRRRRQA